MQLNIPVVGASFAHGVALAHRVRRRRVLVLPTETRTTSTSSPRSDTGKNAGNVVMAGAHLDSVTEVRASTTTDPARPRSSRRLS